MRSFILWLISPKNMALLRKSSLRVPVGDVAIHDLTKSTNLDKAWIASSQKTLLATTILGFTLLEVLMSLFLLAFSMLALQSIEISAARKARANQYYQRALVLSKNMQYYMQNHHGEFSQYQGRWQQQISKLLPEAHGLVTVASQKYQIKITWGGMRVEDCREIVNGVKGCLLINYHSIE